MVAFKVSALLALLPLVVMADEGFTMDQNPGSLVPGIPVGAKDEACIKAYKGRHIDCIPEVMHGITLGDREGVPTEAQLASVCTDTCLSSLRRWIRGSSECGPAKFLKFLMLSNSTTKAAGYKDADIQQFFISTVYWDKCLVDLKKPKNGGSKYCVLQYEEIIASESGHLPNAFTTSDPDDFCKDQTCGAQHGYLWEPKKTIKKYDDKALKGTESIKIENVHLKDVCPKIDTSKYPKREESLSDSDFASAEGAESDEKMANEKSASENGKSPGAAKPELSTNGAPMSNVQASFAISALFVAVGALIL